MQQTPQDACCQQLIAQAGWPSSLLHDGGFARLLERLHQQGFHQRGWGLDHWQIPLSRGIIRHREVSFFSFKDSFEKDCPLFFPFWQPLSGISWSRCPEGCPYISFGGKVEKDASGSLAHQATLDTIGQFLCQLSFLTFTHNSPLQ